MKSLLMFSLAMLYYSQPVYIGLPTDVVLQQTPSVSLQVELDINLPANNMTVQSLVVNKIRGRIDNAKHPIIIVDGGIRNIPCNAHLFSRD